jgi:hypothetical protein
VLLLLLPFLEWVTELGFELEEVPTSRMAPQLAFELALELGLVLEEVPTPQMVLGSEEVVPA